MPGMSITKLIRHAMHQQRSLAVTAQLGDDVENRLTTITARYLHSASKEKFARRKSLTYLPVAARRYQIQGSQLSSGLFGIGGQQGFE